MQIRNTSVLSRCASATFRTLGNAAASQNILTIENASSSNVVIALRDISVSVEATAVLTAVSSVIRLQRTTALPTGGTTLAKITLDTTLPSSANVVLRGATASDGGAATAITATPATGVAAVGFVGRLHTAVGQVVSDNIDLMLRDDAPVIIRAGEAMVVQITNTTAANNPATNHYIVECRWEEYEQRI